MTRLGKKIRLLILSITLFLGSTTPGIYAVADSSSPHLAAYYDQQMAIVDGVTYAWKGNGTPKRIPFESIQVGVGREHFFVLRKDGVLLRFRDDYRESVELLQGIIWFAAGNSGVLAITGKSELLWLSNSTDQINKIAEGVVSAAVGDGANYYITKSNSLFVKGKAHRGQYGDGRLAPTDQFVQTAENAAQITAHTGHAIMLKQNGDVMGTGGNIYGPVGKHGLGDKAERWSKITSGIQAIATGASHSLAIRQDGSLLVWGREYGTEPVPIMAGVVAAAAGSQITVVLKRDGSLWQWAQRQKPRRLILNNN